MTPTLGVPSGDLVRGAVVLDHFGMVNRQILGPPIEVAHGVAANHHQLIDERVGFDHSLARIIHESRLHTAPPIRELPMRLAGKWLDLVFVDAFARAWSWDSA